MLPPELRLRIYDYLLVANEPVKGLSARRTTRYGLEMNILQVNKQTYAEARNVFFGKNTFYITSIPSQSDDDVEGSGAFEPPLQIKDLALIRHLEIDPLYYPKKLRTGLDVDGWKPICPPAERYVMNLTHLLTLVKSTLLTLRFTADTRPYVTFGDEVSGVVSTEDETLDEDAVDVKKVLTAFHAMESNPRFTMALSSMAMIRTVPVTFLFPDSDFDFDVAKHQLCQKGLLFLACHVVFARSEIKIKAMLDELSDDGLDEAEEEEAGQSALVSTGALDLYRRESAGVVQEARRIVEMLK